MLEATLLKTAHFDFPPPLSARILEHTSECSHAATQYIGVIEELSFLTETSKSQGVVLHACKWYHNMVEDSDKKISIESLVFNVASKIIEIIRQTAVTDTQSWLATTPRTPAV